MTSQLYQKARRWGILWLARRLPTCRETTRLVSDSLDRKLPLRQRIKMELHLLICAFCERYRQQSLFLREAMRQAPLHAHEPEPTSAASLSPEARERLKRALSRNGS